MRSIGSAWLLMPSTVRRGCSEFGAHAKERFRNIQIDCRNHANKHAIDSPEITGWKWPY
jgi:hypothetical protein